MGKTTANTLELIAIIVGLAAGLSGLFGAFIILPHRMDAAEEKILKLSIDRDKDHEILTRIDERVTEIREVIKRK